MSGRRRIVDMLEWTTWGKEFCGEDLEAISRYMSIQTYDKGQRIVEQGEVSRHMAFIIEGQVDIVKQSSDTLEKVVVTLKAGTHFGEMAFIDSQPRSASVFAGSDVTLLWMSAENFERILEEHPQIGITMLKLIARLLSQRLRMTTGRLAYLRT
ncbi:Cyclic nucleotide-binding domain-containing protein [Desulfonatronum zhilinae]|nr:Cyclic nucleotide-binding domain-containing protein [Desulfonatronum zhilinae]